VREWQTEEANSEKGKEEGKTEKRKNGEQGDW
jgi:hypothetical protein